VADEPKPAEEPVVSSDIPEHDDATRRSAADLSAADAIPDAEVVEEHQTHVTPPPRPEPELRPAMPEPPEPRAPRRSGAFLGFVLGGVIAAAGGFALARYLPDGWPVADTSALTAQLDQQAATLADLRTQIEALAARETPDVGAELTRLRSELDARFAALPAVPDAAAMAAEARGAVEAALSGIEGRLTDLESRPLVTATGEAVSGAADAALAAVNRELQALKAEVEAQRSGASGASDELKSLAEQTQAQLAAAAAEAEKLKAEAEAAGRAALARAALARIRASLDGGEPYTAAVAELTETGHTVPEVLAASAAAGIPSITELQRSFPAAARAALEAALRADMGDTWTERATSFLRTQTGARSLAPLEGDDPDAILSRAEAALNDGDLTATLAEIDTLPDAAKPPLADWIAEAEQREAATAAIASLSATLDAE
jgi:hypothetical protein